MLSFINNVITTAATAGNLRVDDSYHQLHADIRGVVSGIYYNNLTMSNNVTFSYDWYFGKACVHVSRGIGVREVVVRGAMAVPTGLMPDERAFGGRLTTGGGAAFGGEVSIGQGGLRLDAANRTQEQMRRNRMADTWSCKIFINLQRGFSTM
eukprot:gene9314-16445_t